MFTATCFDSKESSSGYVQNHICLRDNCVHSGIPNGLQGFYTKCYLIIIKYNCIIIIIIIIIGSTALGGPWAPLEVS
jgi:hypothetical protein